MNEILSQMVPFLITGHIFYCYDVLVATLIGRTHCACPRVYRRIPQHSPPLLYMLALGKTGEETYARDRDIIFFLQVTNITD